MSSLTVMNDRNYTMSDAQRAAAVMRRDFLVGTTEKMDEFLVLVGFELGWFGNDLPDAKEESGEKKKKKRKKKQKQEQMELEDADSSFSSSSFEATPKTTTWSSSFTDMHRLCKPVATARKGKQKNHGNSSNPSTRYRDLFRPEAVADLEEWLAPDVYLYEAAAALASEQAKAVKPGGYRAFKRRLDAYGSPAFAADCAAARSAGQLDDVQGILGDQCGLPQARVRHKREVRASRSGEEGKKSES